MKTSFVKNYSKNYILLEDFCDYNYKNDFRIQMLSNNNIDNTLDFSYTIIDNKPIFKYDITSKQSFSSLFQTNLITYRAYSNIILSLMDTIGFLEEYLIDINSLLIDENYIYLDPEKYTTSFIVCPALNLDFYKQLSTFLENVLKRIDHSDDQLVLFAYRLSSEASKDSFNISMLKSIILSSGITPLEQSSVNIFTPNLATQKDNFIPNSNAMSNTTNSVPNIINHDISFLESKNSSLLSNSSNMNNNISSIYNSYSDNFDTNNSVSKDKTLLFTLLNKIHRNPIVMHNKNEKNADLYTISTSFYIKSASLGGIIILILLLSTYFKLNGTISSKLFFIIICITIVILVGSIMYLYSIYPSSKEPVNNSQHDIHNNLTNLYPPTKPLSTLLSQPSPSNDSEEFGDTILLSRQADSKENHHLVYTGTDYIDDVSITSFPFIIGKLKSSANMIINNPLISRIHACIYYENDTYFIEDMNSSNGTYVNDTLLAPHEKFKLSFGDKITFSHLTYIFE